MTGGKIRSHKTQFLKAEGVFQRIARSLGSVRKGLRLDQVERQLKEDLQEAVWHFWRGSLGHQGWEPGSGRERRGSVLTHPRRLRLAYL